MSLDFLRRLAFEGELKNFFAEDIFGFGERATGLSLRFDPEFLYAVGRSVYHSDRFGNRSNVYQEDGFSSVLSQVLVHWDDEKRWDDHHYYPWSKGRREIVQIVVDHEPGSDLRREGRDNFEGFPIKYRQQGPIVPQFACGSQIQAPSTKLGTICGFFEDGATGRAYGLTCGHVANGVGDKMKGSGRLTGTFGDVVAREVPASTGNCNRHAQAGMNSVDAAFVEIDSSVTLNVGLDRTLAAISGINDGDYVTFVGQGSRKSAKARVMSATIWKRFDANRDGNLVCFGDIFEISHPNTQYVATSLSRDGDSGAAVLKPGINGEPDEWIGMLIGSQRSSSYVCYAENVMNWITSAYPNVAIKP